MKGVLEGAPGAQGDSGVAERPEVWVDKAMIEAL